MPVRLIASLTLCLTLAGLPVDAFAQRHDAPSSSHRQIDPHHRNHAFYGRQYRSFTPREQRIWHRGRWVNDWHDGRFAWWWVADDWWYMYPEPIYPYPVYVPPAVVIEQAPPQPTGLPPAQYWYFCENPQGYFPYVASCTVPWRQVPAQPTQ